MLENDLCTADHLQKQPHFYAGSVTPVAKSQKLYTVFVSQLRHVLFFDCFLYLDEQKQLMGRHVNQSMEQLPYMTGRDRDFHVSFPVKFIKNHVGCDYHYKINLL